MPKEDKLLLEWLEAMEQFDTQAADDLIKEYHKIALVA